MLSDRPLWPGERLDAFAVEAMFLAWRKQPPRPLEALEEAFAVVGAADPGGEPARLRGLHQLGYRIVAAGQEATLPCGPAPPYHNGHHVVETVLAMALLCRAAQRAGALDGCDAAAGVVAMAGHDLFHDGSVMDGGVLEARSRVAVDGMADQLGSADRALIGAVILATDPARVEANAACPIVPGAGVGPVLFRLANEADVFASLLPRLGVRLGLLLAQEWRAAGLDDARGVGTARGRLAFLRGYPALSVPAVSLGLQAARLRGLDGFAAVARALEGGGSADDGAAALDRLPPVEAGSRYVAALGLGDGDDIVACPYR